jgi:virulence factor Mce-like protein
MRRVAAIAAVLATAIAGLALLGTGAQAGSTAQVDAIFDTAKGIIPGQLVKIAGARAGIVKDVVLTDDYKARIQMDVDSKFTPFRSDATCAVQPEGLISENFVQCTPGTPKGRELRASGGEAPTVPLKNTSVPVALTDLFNIWRTPVRQRFTLVINTLGIGTAGRGDDFNELLRRANPTLALVRKATAILNKQRREVGTIVEATDRIAAELAERSPRVQDFIEQSGRVTKQTADHRTALAQAVERLPGLLAAAEPALERLDAFAADSTPVVRDLRASAPGLDRAITELGPFSRAARPALARLGSTAVTGRKVARNGKKLVKQLRLVADAAKPTVGRVEGLVTDLVNKGVVEGLLSFVYYATAASARFDSVSHFLPIELTINNCTQYALTPTPGCSSKWADSPSSKPMPASKRAPAEKQAGATAPQAPLAPGTTPAAPGTRLPKLPDLKLPERLQEPVQKILDSVLGGAPGLPGGGGGAPVLPGGSSNRDPGLPLGGLLDYLLLK